MKRIRAGVAGVGHLGSLHAKMLAAIPEAELAGVYDADGEKARRTAEELGTTAFASYEALLEASDAVSIAASTKAHYDLGMKGAARGKFLFIEKPITETVEQAEALNRLAREQGIFIQVGHIERFNPAILAVEKYSLRPLFIESHRLAQFNPRGTDVAVVLDLMIHDIDLILSLVKSEVERIDANGVAVISPSADIANARLTFRNGCVANVTASRISQRRMRKMRLFQEDAYISIDFSDGRAEVFHLADPDDPAAASTIKLGSIDKGAVKRTIVYETPAVEEINPLKHELELFIRAVREGGEPAVSGEEGQRALAVAVEILRQIQSAPFPPRA